jgi:putative hydrolase
MSMPGSGGGDFLGGLLGDLLGMMGSASVGRQNHMELAKAFAQSVATGGDPEPNVDPIVRIKLEELVRLAEMHVSELTGLPVTPSGTPLEVAAVGRGSWAWHTLEDWRFLLDAAPSAEVGPKRTGGGRIDSGGEHPAAGGGEASGAPPANGGDDVEQGLGLADLGDLPDLSDNPSAGAEEMLARFMRTVGPMMAPMQVGSAVGHLAKTTLGQYELPVPRPGQRLLLVPENLEKFAGDWSLDPDEVRLWVCLRDVITHAVLTRPHVASRFEELITDMMKAMPEEASALVDRLADFDLSDTDSLQRLMGDPETLLGATSSPARQRASDQLDALTSALLGYVEHVLDNASTRLLGGRRALAEAWRRRQQSGENETRRAAELIFGREIGSEQVERGSRFVEGVLERAGEEGLSLLWAGPQTLPTPAEVSAPGLWLERIRLNEKDSGTGSEGSSEN